MFANTKAFIRKSAERVGDLIDGATGKVVGTVAATSLACSNANAAVDVSAVVTEIGGAAAPIGLIGGAVLIILVTAAVYKWVRRAL